MKRVKDRRVQCPYPARMTVIDVRTLAPALRHPLIFSTFDALPAGGALELLNDHEPRPLHLQFMNSRADQFDWQVVEAGPAQWRVRITRTQLGAPTGPRTGGCGGGGGCGCSGG